MASSACRPIFLVHAHGSARSTRPRTTIKAASSRIREASPGRQPRQQPPARSQGAGVAAHALASPEAGIKIKESAHSAFMQMMMQGPEAAAAQHRKTKIVCTIGPTSCTREGLFELADSGMNVVRLNMSHGDHASHQAVIDLVREYNALGRHTLAIMLDTKGPEVRSGDVAEPLELATGDQLTFTIVEGADGKGGRVSVNYDGFIDDVSVGDTLLVDGGIMSFAVRAKTDTDVLCEAVDGGTMKSRRHLNIRGKSANLPAITDRDWADLKFGLDAGVDYYALSFVRSSEVIHELKAWLVDQGATGTASIGVLAKIESADSVTNLDSILDAADGAMVARGDLGAELPVEEVPYWQSRIVQGCRQRGKPVIVATNMLESMISNATPTRAEVSDIAIAVREGTDAVMLSGETAFGAFPMKALSVMSTVSARTEAGMQQYSGTRRYGSDEAAPIDWIAAPGSQRIGDSLLSEMFAYHATTMANTMQTSLLVFSRKGNMPALLSHYRPDNPIYCFTENFDVQRRLALYHGVTALHMSFSEQAEVTFDRAIHELKRRGLVQGGQQVAIVQSGRQPIWRSSSTHAIQVRQVPRDPEPESEDEAPGTAY